MTHNRDGDQPAEFVIRFAVSPSRAIESARLEAQRQQHLHETFFGKATETPQEPRKEDESMGCTTQGEKIDSRGVSGPGMGVLDECFRDKPRSLHELPPDAGAHEPEANPAEGKVWDASQERTSEMAERYRDARIRESLSLIMAELPGLLEDREKLRKLREVLGED